jgi:hypothetical protein
MSVRLLMPTLMMNFNYLTNYISPDNQRSLYSTLTIYLLTVVTTHVSKTPEYLVDVLRESASGRMIMKPLDGYGGQGIVLV